MAAKDITIGDKFGRWEVIGSPVRAKYTTVRCRCECGIEKDVRPGKLFDGTSKSCGCLRQELRTTHGMTATDVRRDSHEYWIWNTIVQRCTNPKIPNWMDYGGRGISMCDAWLKFENFYADMGQRPTLKHSIERRDNDGDYCPENCYWATRMEQGKNKRNNRWLTAFGKTQHLAEWSREFNIQHTTILARLRAKWSIEDAISTPVNSAYHRKVA